MDRTRITVCTQGFDDSLALVGGPEPTDMGNVGLILDTTPTPSRTRRTLARLASIFVPIRVRAHIVDVSQLLTIAAHVQSTESTPGQNGGWTGPDLLIERQVVTPMWKFPDGNVTWYLRRCPAGEALRQMPTAFVQRGYSTELYQYEPAILYNHLPAEPGGYFPPGAGIAPGAPIGALGTWHDMRYPFRKPRANAPLNLEVVGPCIICAYASIWQTDPETRAQPAAGPDQEMVAVDCAIEPEDKFWLCNPLTTRYHRIGIELVVDLEPLAPLPEGSTGCCGASHGPCTCPSE